MGHYECLMGHEGRCASKPGMCIAFLMGVPEAVKAHLLFRHLLLTPLLLLLCLPFRMA